MSDLRREWPGGCDCAGCDVAYRQWLEEQLLTQRAQLAAIDALVVRYREAEPRFNRGNPDMVSAHTLLLVVLDELEALRRGEVNSVKTG